MSGANNYRLLIEKLDQFIRKYYVNQVIRGALYSIAVILVFFLGITFLENEFYFNTGVRKVMFFSFLGISALSLYGWVLRPLFHYFHLGKIISHEQAAQIIGNHFADVKDKLLNILQLKQQADAQDQRDLILASIDQKSEEIKLVPFKSAINLGQNKKYLRYALPPLLLLLVLLFAAPTMIKDSASRLLHNGREYEKPAPFHFNVNADALQVVQFEDYLLSVEVDGNQLPNDAFIEIEGYQYRLTKDAPNRFSYRFNNVQKETEFHLYSSGVSSREYNLEVLRRPNLAGFEVKLDYPSYTLRKDETLNSIGDLVVPVGTNIDWIFNSENTDAINLFFSKNGKSESANRFSDDLFTFKKRAMEDEAYKLYISNKALPNADSISYTLSIIPDLYPTIKAEKFVDSTDRKLLFFVGDASDDYGLLSLSFNYRVRPSEGEEGELHSVKMPKPDGKEIRYDYTFNMADLELKPGDQVTYYFEVFDNDGVNGSKSAKTNPFLFAMPTVEEFEAMADQNSEQIKKNLSDAMEESRKIQEEMKKMREKLLQERDLDWKSKKDLEKMLDRQKELQKQIDQAKQDFQENLQNQQEYSETDQKIMEKQQQLQQLFDEVMSDQMKELMQQIEDMLQELEKDNALEMMEDVQFNDEEVEKELDRLLELYKNLELEKEMQETQDKLQELAEEQEKLSDQTENKDLSQEELDKKQEELNEKFEDVQEKMEDIQEKNQDLESPKDIDDFKQEMQDIQQDMEKSQEQIQQNQNSKASKSQKNAAKNMKSMAMSMAMQMQSQEMEQMQEDMQSLRQLLENLVGLSFDQEDLIASFDDVEVSTPKYVELVQQQFKLEDDFRLVQDTLQALSKRVYQIESFVTEKVTEIKSNMRTTLEDLEDRRKSQAADNQQLIMKNVNDLALMLSEVMNQMQQQMSGMMSGQQMCTNPGGQGKNGNVPKDKMSQGQEQLNQQMQQMRDALKKGGKGSSEEFAKMAAKQSALRNALREKQKEMQQKGQGDKSLQDLIDKMDQTETELVNKQLTNEMMERQAEILTRLLEHEKAEREREYDNKRKAEAASQKERKMPPSLEEYLKKRESEIEMYRSVSPSLKPYYKSLVDEYFKTLKSAQ